MNGSSKKVYSVCNEVDVSNDADGYNLKFVSIFRDIFHFSLSSVSAWSCIDCEGGGQ